MKKKRSLTAIMRVTVINIALCLTLVSGAIASSSKAQVLDKKISLEAKDEEMRKVLVSIEKEANITFIYSPVLVQTNNKVTVKFKNESLLNILSMLLKPQNIKYEVSGNVIVLNRMLAAGDEPENQTMRTPQEIPVTGIVTDETGAPILGVSVTVKGSSVAVSTDIKGGFKIKVPDGSAVLVFRSVGYLTQEVVVGNNTVIDVQLKTDSKSLNEVVVVGYGSQKKSTLTGAITSLNARTINALPVASVEQALQGRVAGLNVTNNGAPGTQPIVTIRGISSINFASDPLYVIDGFPTGNLSSFDSKDIESVEVLKDASAAAIYGSRATNGVILITTKKGVRNGKVQVSLDSYAGIQSPSKTLDLLNTEQYVQYATMLLGADKLPPRLSQDNFNKPIYAGASQTYAQTNTDWQDAYFKRNALITSNNVSLAGGNDVSRFYTSAGYFKQDGIAQALSYDRYNYRINSDHKISKVFTFGQNLYSAVSNQHYDATQGNRTQLTNVVRMLPYIPLHDPTTNGGFQGPISSFDGSDPTNPVESALIGSNTIKTIKILGTAFLDVNFTPWLKFRSTFGIDYTNGYTQNYTPIYNDGGTLSATSASIANQRVSSTTKLYTQQLSFDKSFGAHHIAATAVYEQQGLTFTTETSSGNQATNLVKTLNGASNITANNINESNLLQSFVGRVNYDFAGKYLLSGSIRRDGLSIWAPGHKYANFPSASIGWKIDQEDFLKNNPSVSELKLRAGYGLTGIPPGGLGNYPYLSPVNSNQAFYPIGNIAPGSANASFTNGLSNPNLSWEKTKQLNIGVDLGLYNNTITVVAEFFKRKTDNLILTVPTAPSQGFQGVGTLANIGAMQNTGGEIQLGYHKRDGEFKWDITGLLSIIRNKVLKLNTANASIPSGSDADFGGGDVFTNTIAGRPVQSFYGWIADGIFKNAAEIANSPTQANAAPGDIKFKDISGPQGKPDGVIDSYDRTYIGSFLPKFTYSLNYTANYKNFDLAIFFQGVQGNKILDAERIILEGMPRLFNAGTQVLNAWTPQNPSSTMPRAIAGDPNRNGRLSTRWIEDGSYLRLKNVMIGYSLPQSVLRSFANNAISRLKFYVSGQNLLTFTKYKGFDPEVGNKNQNTSGGNLTNGVDFGQYPVARSFQFGIQAGF
ncbi:TonB-linked outer membrane protein, SusC/RagA family [Mucilaginibacter sp. OK268]|uniref:TonB-dependent receptor n=1 Tax=Mucilaginibacter sp. OK268 TaxID=1881048 RepID=UPI00088D4D49|nr:TonB-dependent receptor [Mucilaginibacter sp. OK268]SDP28431.1 TonB-linked outer membrane protein, SusC/RagA family [Mucilaginibacter sp. OK268]